jgi:hypothetical protein
MPVRFAVIPVERTEYQRGPMYLRWRSRDEQGPFIEVTRWSMIDYGLIDRAVIAVDAESAALAALDAMSGVIAIPANLDATPNLSARNQVQSRLEAVNVPAQWVVAGLTWRSILRTVTGMFLFMQAISARTGDTPFDWPGVTWTTTFGQLQPADQAALQDAAASQGWQGTIPSGATMRQILKSAADLWQAKPLYFGFVEL